MNSKTNIRNNRIGKDKPEITRAHWLTLIFCTLAWLFDGFDGSIFTLIMGPMMTEIGAEGGTPATADTIALYGGLAVSIYLFGWALGSMTFGVLADYFGRVKMLVVSVAMFSIFAASISFVDQFWLLLVFRFLSGIGSGAAFPIGATLVGEVWNNRYRAKAVSFMASGYAAGYFLSSMTYGLMGEAGWRSVMLLCAIPLVVLLPLAFFVRDPQVAVEARKQRREAKVSQAETSKSQGFPIVELFSPRYRRTTILALILSIGSLISFWSITTWVPQIIRSFSEEAGMGAGEVTTQIAIATAVLNLGGFVGYLTWGFIADAIGRKWAFSISILSMWGGSLILFPGESEFWHYLVLLPIIGFGMFGTFSGCAVWIPEQFPTEIRATGLSFTNGFGRMLTSFGPLVAGTIAISVFGGSLQLAITTLATMGLVAFVGIIFLPETRGQKLKSQSDLPSSTNV